MNNTQNWTTDAVETFSRQAQLVVMEVSVKPESNRRATLNARLNSNSARNTQLATENTKRLSGKSNL